MVNETELPYCQLHVSKCLDLYSVCIGNMYLPIYSCFFYSSAGAGYINALPVHNLSAENTVARHK